MTDDKKPLDDDQSSAPAQKSTSPSATDKTSSTNSSKADKLPPVSSQKKSPPPIKKTVQPAPQKQKVSKTALLSLLLALVAIAGVAASYYWLDQQREILSAKFETTVKRYNSNNQQRVNQLLAEQKANFSTQLAQLVKKTEQQSAKKLSQLESAIARLETNKPNDWLIHEAEYLIRIAARTLWLESDTKAASNLLKDADTRLSTLNDPAYLPIRQRIHQDIESLALMPVLNTENVVLSLMGLNQQLPNLPLQKHQVNDDVVTTPDLDLTSNVGDWQSNLSKTWQRFLDTFVVIHIRDGSAKPLLTPQYQQNLKENISLKLQQAQWAAREAKPELYLQTLNEIQTWFNDYFDMTKVNNQAFVDNIEQLKGELISYDYPSSLSSLDAIRQLLRHKPTTYHAVSVEEPTIIAPTNSDIVVEKSEAAGQTMVDEVSKNNEATTETIEKNADVLETAEEKITLEERLHQQRVIQETIDEQKKASGDNL